MGQPGWLCCNRARGGNAVVCAGSIGEPVIHSVDLAPDPVRIDGWANPFDDAGKLMALASFSKRSEPSNEEEKIIAFLMQDCSHLKPKECEVLRNCPYYNVGLEDPEFRNFAGILVIGYLIVFINLLK